jgi:hypothetical protein
MAGDTVSITLSARDLATPAIIEQRALQGE